MTVVQVLGAGAFGTALAVVLVRAGRDVRLMARDPALATRRESSRLPGVTLPDGVAVTDAPDPAAGLTLLAVPMQAQAAFLAQHGHLLRQGPVVSCAKGIDLATLQGAVSVIEAALPGRVAALLTGPGFAADIAAGLPTAMVLACRDDAAAQDMQAALSTPVLRLYRTADVTGAELGGALKNVIAIAAGVAMGAGLGLSARAAIIARGQAELARLALAMGAKAETLTGLSGLGDLVLTCTSERSRNYRCGLAIGAGQPMPEGETVEGAATAGAALRLAEARGIEMPLTATVAALVAGRVTLAQAVQGLLSRPLTTE
ncbi:MAG: NAD(P)H-dependent glycerol-3-phosphate dehydrogenase [Gemmobacter sp.]